MTVSTILFFKLFNEFLVFSNCFGDKKNTISNGYANKFLVLQLLWRPVISIQPYFQKLLQKAQRTHMLIFVIKSPQKKRLNFEFDFNHWVLYVRLAKRTDFSIIDPKKTFFHPFQGIYCNYNEKIRQKCDLVIFFDWGVIWLI